MIKLLPYALEGFNTEMLSTFNYMVDTLDEEALESLEVRLRLYKGQFDLYYGDPSYDTDHRGSWSSCSITSEDTLETCNELLIGMYKEVIDSRDA